jgi:Fe-S-cluster-containing dehydrogenase component/CRP-like cAMP-binding protein
MAADWPEQVFRAPLLRELDARGRRELAQAGRLLSLSAGETVFESGARGDALFVVAEGTIALAGQKRGEVAATELRRVGEGESFGEESSIGATFRATARAVGPSVVASIPVAMFQRALGRAGGSEVVLRHERRLRRRATAELLATLSFSASLGERDIELLLDGASHRAHLRGDAIYRAGEAATHLYLVVDGMVQLQSEDDERVRVRAYLSRGDFFGDEEVLARAPRRESAVASGATLLIAVPAELARTLADRNPALLRRLRRVAEGAAEAQRAVVAETGATQHAFKDLYRLQVARSLLVINLDDCVRCGHCAWACESLHGVARLARRGEKIVTRLDASTPASLAPLLLPNSCQHCESPACMPDCPTGAIGRDPRGEVFIRDELCTGCGACAKGCPWDNIQIVPRPAGAKKPAGGVFEDLAVKCDLCRDHQGPACVQACPTEAILRLNPGEALPDVARMLQRDPTEEVKPRAGWSWVGLAAGAAAALVTVGATLQARGTLVPWRGLGFAAGIATALGFLALLGYAVPKRFVRTWQRRGTSRMKPQLMAHTAIGLASLGLAAMHGGVRFGASSGGALLGAFWLCALLGSLGGLFYAFIPRRLSRLERKAVLPEDYARARSELSTQLYAGVTGKSELVKKLFEKVLSPYLRRPLGWVLLVAGGRTLAEEEKAVRARIDAMLQGRGLERLAGLEQLIRLVVELRALGAQRALTLLLRAWLPLHVVAAALALVLLVIHLVEVLG